MCKTNDLRQVLYVFPEPLYPALHPDLPICTLAKHEAVRLLWNPNLSLCAWSMSQPVFKMIYSRVLLQTKLDYAKHNR